MAAIAPTQPGNFSPDGKSFCFPSSNLSGVWDHYISNGLYCVVLSQTWCGYSFYLSRPLYPVSISGRYAFIRDEDSQEVWPVNEPIVTPGKTQTYEELHGLSGDQTAGAARFRTSLGAPPLTRGHQELTTEWGLGYARITCLHDQISTAMTLRVDPEDPVEIWKIRLENRSNRARRLTLMPTTAFHLGAGIQMAGNATVCMFTDLHPELHAVMARMEGIRKTGVRNIVGFFAAAQGPSGKLRPGETDGFGTLDSAQQALLSGDATPAAAVGEEAVALLRSQLEVPAGQSVTMTYIVGVAPDVASAKATIRRYSSPRRIEQSRAQLDRQIDALCDSQTIQTPDPQLDRFYNSWLKYEMLQTARWTRGEGCGYRDILQDSEGAVLLDPQIALRLFYLALERQRKDGWAVREFEETLPGITSTRDFRDSAVWIIYALDTILRETGDLSLLDEQVPYVDGGSGSVFEHAFSACKFLMNHRGRHGLPLIAGGDWNDALDRVGIAGKGESVWLAIALHRAIVMLRDIAARIGRKPAHRQLAAWRQTLEEAIQSAGWDGKWYARAFDDAGRVVGSSKCKQGRIFLLPQAWAAFSGLTDAKRVEQAIASADRYLRSDWGPPKLWPAYTRRDDSLGRITARAAGLGENAGIHTHAVTFKMKADLALGRGTAAYELLQKIAPIGGHPASMIPIEPPYVLCNQRVGPENPEFGAHKNRWLSGSVSWVFRLITEDMLGARADIDGLRIAPCLPADWTQCRIVRDFRGARYDVRITKPAGVQRGRVRLSLDGKSVEGDLLPPPKDRRTHVVQCVIQE